MDFIGPYFLLQQSENDQKNLRKCDSNIIYI